MKTGLLLLSGGSGVRMGAPKHALEHLSGGSWGGHLVRVFEAVFPGRPVLVLGDPLPDWPNLPRLDDPREGPAVALRTWAAADLTSEAERWWVVACDQVRWTAASLRQWSEAAEAADPSAAHWVLAHHGGHLQPLGGWLPGHLRSMMALSPECSLMALAVSLPHLTLPREGAEWVDIDTPEARRDWEAGRA